MVAGALLAVGIVNCGVQDEVDPALALLSGKRWSLGVCRTLSCSSWSAVCWGGMAQICTGRAHACCCATLLAPRHASADYVSKDDPQTRIGAILGLGIAYAGRQVGCQDAAWVALGGSRAQGLHSVQGSRHALLSAPHDSPPDCTGLPFIALVAVRGLEAAELLPVPSPMHSWDPTPHQPVSGCLHPCREKEEVAELLLPLVMDTDLSMEVGWLPSLNCGLAASLIYWKMLEMIVLLCSTAMAWVLHCGLLVSSHHTHFSGCLAYSCDTHPPLPATMLCRCPA